jgi:hypothetical protein
VTGRRLELWVVVLVGIGWAIAGLHYLFCDRTRLGVTLLTAAVFTWLGLLTIPRPDDRPTSEDDE